VRPVRICRRYVPCHRMRCRLCFTICHRNSAPGFQTRVPKQHEQESSTRATDTSIARWNWTAPIVGIRLGGTASTPVQLGGTPGARLWSDRSLSLGAVIPQAATPRLATPVPALNPGAQTTVLLRTRTSGSAYRAGFFSSRAPTMRSEEPLFLLPNCPSGLPSRDPENVALRIRNFSGRARGARKRLVDLLNHSLLHLNQRRRQLSIVEILNHLLAVFEHPVEKIHHDLSLACIFPLRWN
jgi:hypothetical protein